MEDENQFFGNNAGTVENNENLESEEKFSIYHNQDEAKNNIDISSKELTDFVDSLIQDVPDLSDEEINEGIENILKKAYSTEEIIESSKNSKTKKITLRVLFVAALLSAVFASCIFVVGTSHNISIENGFVTFTKEAVKIVFFGKDKEQLIDAKTLIEDLESHGFKNVLLPQKLYHYKSSVPAYSKSIVGEKSNDRVEFELSKNTSSYLFKIEKVDSEDLTGNYFAGLENAETIIFEDAYIYVFEFEGKVSCIRFIYDEYDYLIQSYDSISETINTAKTIIKMEE